MIQWMPGKVGSFSTRGSYRSSTARWIGFSCLLVSTGWVSGSQFAPPRPDRLPNEALLAVVPSADPASTPYVIHLQSGRFEPRRSLEQNLQELLDLVPAKVKAAQPHLPEAWKALLWQGQIEQLRQAIEQTITSKSRRQPALNKWQNYFARHQHRMQYQTFQQANLPCGR